MKSDEIIEKIRHKLKLSNPDKRSVMNIFQFNFTDADGKLLKSVVFDFKELNIYDGSISHPDGEITIADEDFHQIGSKQITFDEIIKNNKVEMKGDTEAINKLLDKFRSNFKDC